MTTTRACLSAAVLLVAGWTRIAAAAGTYLDVSYPPGSAAGELQLGVIALNSAGLQSSPAPPATWP